MTPSSAYEARADEYTNLLGSMSAVHPSDRQLVESWAELADGRVLDAGCGPGHWTHHLARRGIDVRGIDLAPSFIARARSRFPGVRFDVGSICTIEELDGALGGVLSWFSTIHFPPPEIPTPLREFARVLQPGGHLLVGHFVGPTVEPFDHAVARAYRWPIDALREVLEASGFTLLETHRRESKGERPVGAIVAEKQSTSSTSR